MRVFTIKEGVPISIYGFESSQLARQNLMQSLGVEHQFIFTNLTNIVPNFVEQLEELGFQNFYHVIFDLSDLARVQPSISEDFLSTLEGVKEVEYTKEGYVGLVHYEDGTVECYTSQLLYRIDDKQNTFTLFGSKGIILEGDISEIYHAYRFVETGETYSFVENLKDYITFEAPGVYILSADFYPELKQLSDTTEVHVTSNRLGLEIKPAPAAAALGAVPIASVSREVLQPQPLSPDKVIAYMLSARQKSQWDQFFLYLDVERMIARDPVRNRRYKAEAESGRMSMIDTYKHDLMQARTDKDVAIIPVEFKIERTIYSATEAEVTVIEWFDYTSFREKKRFTYNLSSRDDIWTVYDYSVENLGTE